MGDHAGWKLSVTSTDSDNADALEAFLETLGAGAVSRSVAQNAIVRFDAYFDIQPDISLFTRNADLPAYGDLSLEPLPEIDWVSESQKNLPPVHVPPFMLHGAHDRPAMRGGRQCLEVEAGLAFGSGHHGTTKGCLALLTRLAKRRKISEMHLADIGCGSGVLAMAAARLGAPLIYASDIDPDAIAVTRANAKLNRLSPQITAFCCAGMTHPNYRTQRFDLIFANILARPLVHLAPVLVEHLDDGGRLIVSGLLREQARMVLARYRQLGLWPEARCDIGEWTSLTLRR